MTSIIEVRVAGRGRVRAGERVADPATVARCDLCGADTDVVVSTSPDGTGPFGCKACLRGRLEAITIALYELKEPGGQSGLPWGKLSG
jgi:hypothetical protein